MAFVVIGDLSLRDCAVATAKSARWSAVEIPLSCSRESSTDSVHAARAGLRDLS